MYLGIYIPYKVVVAEYIKTFQKMCDEDEEFFEENKDLLVTCKAILNDEDVERDDIQVLNSNMEIEDSCGESFILPLYNEEEALP